MAITINIEELNIVPIDRQRCLRAGDIQSITEIAKEINGKSEMEIVELARQICNYSERNERARHNETNITNVKRYIVNNCYRGDVLTFSSVLDIWNEVNYDPEGAGRFAILAALDDLVENGTLERRRMKKRMDYGSSHHIDIYIVK